MPGEGGEGTCTNGGLLYWYPLQFGSDGRILNVTWEDEVRFEMRDGEGDGEMVQSGFSGSLK